MTTTTTTAAYDALDALVRWAAEPVGDSPQYATADIAALAEVPPIVDLPSALRAGPAVRRAERQANELMARRGLAMPLWGTSRAYPPPADHRAGAVAFDVAQDAGWELAAAVRDVPPPWDAELVEAERHLTALGESVFQVAWAAWQCGVAARAAIAACGD